MVCLTGASGVGLLSAAIERSSNPSEPTEALRLARQLLGVFGDRLYFELAFHGRAVDKLVNRGLLALGERLEVPVVATNAVRYARPEDALAATVLESVRRGARPEGLLNTGGARADQLPMLTVDHPRSQAYLKSAREMWRLFGRLPAALEATSEIVNRCRFRLPLAERTPADARYGPALLFGLNPVRDHGDHQLLELAESALKTRWQIELRGPLPSSAIERVQSEARAICSAGLAELLLLAHEVAAFCRQQRIPMTARGSATASLVAWALGLTDLCPLDHGLDGRSFLYAGRPELPDLDLEVSSLHEPVVARFLQRQTHPDSAQGDTQRRELPRVNALRLGVHVSMGSRQAVRAVGTALGLEAPRVNALARLVPLLSSPGAIEQVMAHAPELGIHDLSTQAEPYNTVLRLAGQLEGLPHRPGPHPSAYTFDPYGPGVLEWLPAHWVGSDRWSRQRFGTARHLAVATEEQGTPSDLAHLAARPANEQASAWSVTSDTDEDALPDLAAAGGPTLACQWDKVRWGGKGKKIGRGLGYRRGLVGDWRQFCRRSQVTRGSVDGSEVQYPSCDLYPGAYNIEAWVRTISTRVL
jgi:DNA polymerase III subunit alpha